MPLGKEVGLSPDDTVLDGDPALLKRAQPPIFAHVYCGQTAVCVTIPLGTEVGLSLGDTVRWGAGSPSNTAVSYTHLTLPTIYSV